MSQILLFTFGLVFGSFLNVVALRYDGDHGLFDPKIIGGRSRCPTCGKTLRWFELIPLVSFLLQVGKCRACDSRVSIQYPIVELVSGFIFVLVPWRLASFFALPSVGFWVLGCLWIAVFMLLLLISYVDIRLGIIPDEGHVILGVLAIGIAATSAIFAGTMNSSFFGGYAFLFGLQDNIWIARVIGMVVGFVFFELLVLVTRGKGMGMGDVKLALPLGFLFGWPDIIFVILAAFVTGAAFGVLGIMLKKKTMRGTLPFGPFLAVGVMFVFFFGFGVMQWYLQFLRI